MRNGATRDERELMKRNLASDNNATVHPEIMDALTRANTGHAVGYGDDDLTRQAEEAFRSIFEADTGVFFVYNGTAANVLGISAAARSFQALLCAETAHVHVDECGAVENFGGLKTIPLPSHSGKIHPEDLFAYEHYLGFEHHSQPKVVSITQATEYGTVYSLEETKALADATHKLGWFLHMDGARLANAAVALEADMREMTADLGVDILSFGGTKNGMMFGEAILLFEPSLVEDFKYIRKQGMQLHSKMRYISAQFLALLEDDLWRRNAVRANELAKLLERELLNIPGVTITTPVETNAVFAVLPSEIVEPLREKFFFYDWDPSKGEVRFVTAFDNTEEDIRVFTETIKTLIELP